MNTPPETEEEQEKCLRSRRGCWRKKGARGKNAAGSSSEASTDTADAASGDQP